MAIEASHGATSDDELVDRILLRYTNEAALCIQEEVIRTPQVICCFYSFEDNSFSRRNSN